MSIYPFEIVFVSDTIIDNKQYSIERNDAEGNSRKVVNEIVEALKPICEKVRLYDDIKLFMNDISTMKNTVVLASRFGPASPSSKAQIPAICEAYNIPFVGADSYTHMICNDKYLSKKYLREFDLHTANAVLIYDANSPIETSAINFLHFPVVIKPNYGGGSTGITESSVQFTLDGAISYVKCKRQT